MDGQSRQTSELLDKNGWESIEARKLDHHWYVEQRLTKSIWSPTDCYVLFNFETDPQISYAGEKPVAGMITVGLRKPISWIGETGSEFEKNEVFDDWTTLYLGRSIEKKIPEFFKELADMRQKFYNFYN